MPSTNSHLLAADQEPSTTVTLLEADHTVGRVQRTVLPTGLRVITEKKNAAAATVMFGVAVGSRDEEPQEYGAAHFLEHLASCGTETRSKDDILAEGERIGGRSNAGTGAEHTTYFATVLPRDVPAALDLIGDMVTRPQFTSADVDNERRIILQEIARRYDNLAQSIGDEVLSGLYGPTSPHGHLIGGSHQSLEQLTVADIERFHQSQYVPTRTVVVVTGDVDHDMVVTQAQKFFPDHPRGVASRPRPSGQVQVQHGSVRSPRESLQSHVAVAVEGVACTDPRTPAQNILGAALGGLRSSQMYYRIREERGLAYTVDCKSRSRTDTGLLWGHAGCAPKDVDEVLDLLRQAISGSASRGFSPDTLERARAYTAAQAMDAWERGRDRAEELFLGEMGRGRPVALSEDLAALNAVTLEDLHEIASQLCSRPQLTVLLGNV